MIFKEIQILASNLPVSLIEIKQHLRLTTTAEDALLLTYLESAKKEVEGLIGMSIDTRKVTLKMSNFCGINILPDPPIHPDTLVVKYLDENSVENTLADTNYSVISISENEVGLFYKVNAVLPTTLIAVDSVSVEYETGFLAVPEDIKIAIKMIVADYFEFRSDRGQSFNDTRVMRLLRKYRQYA